MLPLVLALVLAPTGTDGPYAPTDRPGPALSVSRAALDASLVCTGDLAKSPHEPVLLVPGTGGTPQQFDWNWGRALDRLGWARCTVALPASTTGDIQVAAEYVTDAIRQVHSRSGGRKVQVVGHSQGGMVGRWSLRFWPDTRAMVDDLAGMVPSNHGSTLLDGMCTPDCAAAIWQQRASSSFMKALNSEAETFAGVSYTNVYTHTDEFIQPNLDATGSSSLHTGAGRISNVAIQDVCPNDATDHLGAGTWSNTVYQVVMDALTHDGPADPTRVPLTVCTEDLQPGVDKTTFATDLNSTLVPFTADLAGAEHVPAEPALACYTQLVCAAAAPAAPAVVGAPTATQGTPSAAALAATGAPPLLPVGAVALVAAALGVLRRTLDSGRPRTARRRDFGP